MQFGLTGGISRPLTETVMRGHISALRETVIRECFATQSANLTVGWVFCPIFSKQIALAAIFTLPQKYFML